MEQSFFDSYLVHCDELKADDFKTSSVVIFQGDQIPKTFSLNTITSLLESEEYPWLFIAKEVLKTNFYIAIGFEENTDIPLYTTNILCIFIRNKIFISNVFKCSKSSAKFLKICRKHKNAIQLEQNKETSESLSVVEEQHEQVTYFPDIGEETIKTTIDITEIQISNEEGKKENSAHEQPPLSELSLYKLPAVSIETKWTERLPQFKWVTPIKEYSIAQTEIEASLGLFNDIILVEDASPLKLFQNAASEQLMHAPHSSEKFINRIISHESIFDPPDPQDSVQ